MIAPPPYKRVCQKCGHTKIIAPKSDALDLGDIPPLLCKKCGGKYETKDLDPSDRIPQRFGYRILKKYFS